MTNEAQRRDRREYMRAYRARMSPEQKAKVNQGVRVWEKKNPERVKIYRKRDYQKHRDREREYTREWRAAHPGMVGKYCKAQRIRILQEMVEAYGGRCVCCGESRVLFLTIDHVNNDGAAERKGMGDGPTPNNKKGRAGINFYRYLKKMGYPQDKYRLLCFNCNCGRARNDGFCPHQLTNDLPEYHI